ncbi:MAG: hypothetical protein HOP10_00565 [Chitinophagaceae bacterium]|nr:hypothetical protein [Chitinophagaceae bacterium]
MKKNPVLLLTLLLLVFSGCKKAIEQTQEDLVIKAMTDGHWKVTNFRLNGTDITADFTGYKFKYYSNKTVDAIKNGSVEMTGQWDGNSSNNTTWANFTSAAYPLILINGTWHIDRNSWVYVEASQTVGSDTRIMRLDKE